MSSLIFLSFLETEEIIMTVPKPGNTRRMILMAQARHYAGKWDMTGGRGKGERFR